MMNIGMNLKTIVIACAAVAAIIGLSCTISGIVVKVQYGNYCSDDAAKKTFTNPAEFADFRKKQLEICAEDSVTKWVEFGADKDKMESYHTGKFLWRLLPGLFFLFAVIGGFVYAFMFIKDEDKTAGEQAPLYGATQPRV